MENLLLRFNTSVDLQGIRKDLFDMSGDSKKQEVHEKVPYGTYEVRVEKMEIKESKKGDPMFSVWFRIIDGQYKNGMIFFNKLLTKGFLISACNDLMKSFKTGINIEFEDFIQYNDVIQNVFKKINNDGLEFAIEYSDNGRGYGDIQVTDVFEI